MAAKGDFAQPFNMAVSYVKDGETISVYLFRATHPNAALWFERAQSILQEVWKSRGLGAGGETRTIQIAGSPAPNGLMRVFALSGQLKSTAIAVAQVGGWMVKVRSTSMQLGVEEQAERMQRVFTSLGGSNASWPVNPIAIPEACSANLEPDPFADLLNGQAIEKPNGETIIAAGPALLAAADQAAGGKDSLAAAPHLWCRAKLDAAGPMGTLYRPKDGSRKDWTALVADSGTSISGLETLILKGKKVEAGGMLVANGLGKARVILIAGAVPAPAPSFMVGAKDLMSGSTAAMVATAYGSGTLEVALPK